MTNTKRSKLFINNSRTLEECFAIILQNQFLEKQEPETLLYVEEVSCEQVDKVGNLTTTKYKSIS